MSQQNKTINSCALLPRMLTTDYQNSFADRFSDKFTVNSYLNIPPHRKYVATCYVVKYECHLSHLSWAGLQLGLGSGKRTGLAECL